MIGRYFWLKLRTDFFQSDDIKLIQGQKNGAQYVLFWLRLLLKAIEQEEPGMLRYRENLPYSPQILSTILDTDIDVVKSSLELFTKLGMVEIRDDGTIWIEQAIELVGSETDSAKRMRRLRKQHKEIEDKTSQRDNNVARCDVEKRRVREEKRRKEKNSTKSTAPSAASSEEPASVVDVDDSEERRKISAEARKKRPELFKRKAVV